MKTFLKNLGSQIRILRAIKGLTQSNVANEIKITASAFAKIERGESDISISRIEEIAKVFKLSASKLISLADSLYEQSAGGIVSNSYETELQNLKSQVTRLHKKVESLSERLRKIEN